MIAAPFLRLDVPALQEQAVARRELDLLVGSAEVGRGHVWPGRMRDDVRERGGDQDERRGDEGRGDDQQAARVPPPEPVARRRERQSVAMPSPTSTRPAAIDRKPV